MSVNVTFVFHREGEAAMSAPPVPLEVIMSCDSMLSAACRFPGRKLGEPINIELPEHVDPMQAYEVVWLLDQRRRGIQWEMHLNSERRAAVAMDFLCVPLVAEKAMQLLRRAVFLWNVKRFVRKKDRIYKGRSFISRPRAIGLFGELHASPSREDRKVYRIGAACSIFHGATWSPVDLNCQLVCRSSGFVLIDKWKGELKWAIPSVNVSLRFSEKPDRVMIRGSVFPRGVDNTLFVNGCTFKILDGVAHREFAIEPLRHVITEKGELKEWMRYRGVKFPEFIDIHCK